MVQTPWFGNLCPWAVPSPAGVRTVSWGEQQNPSAFHLHHLYHLPASGKSVASPTQCKGLKRWTGGKKGKATWKDRSFLLFELFLLATWLEQSRYLTCAAEISVVVDMRIQCSVVVVRTIIRGRLLPSKPTPMLQVKPKQFMPPSFHRLSHL